MTKIVRRLTKGKFIEKVVQCMEICDHRWVLGDDEFRVPTKEEVKDTIEYLVNAITKDSCYNETGQTVEATGGGIKISCWCDCTDRHWIIIYTGLSQNSFIAREENEKV